MICVFVPQQQVMSEMSEPGFDYLDDFITHDEEQALLDFFAKIDNYKNTGSRRMLAYGYCYLKGEHGVSLHPASPIPDCVKPVLTRIEKKYDRKFDQLTVNEYLPGQGIDAHYDHRERFGPVIVGLSLGSGCGMIFEGENNFRREQFLKPRSLYMMSHRYRYPYTHRIRKVHSDTVDGQRVDRKTRISLTFRQSGQLSVRGNFPDQQKVTAISI
jgi:alkylated DNA repair dioxygenase AlkB